MVTVRIPAQHRAWRIRAVITVLVLLTVMASAAFPAVSVSVFADGLPYIPVVTTPETPTDAPLPSPVSVAAQPAPAPPSVVVADTATPLPAAVAVQPEPSPVPASVPVVDTSVPFPVAVAAGSSKLPANISDGSMPGAAPASDTPAAAPVAVGVPRHIRIAAAGIDANVEVVGLENDGSVGTPKNYDNTGWYEPGPRPGEAGNAVMVGHVDSAVLKRGAVFWNLRLVKPGDDITVISDDGVAHHFTVTGQQQYNPQNVPIEQIFGQADGVHLNLITCDSTTPFNRRTGEYGGWLLVTADATP